MGPYKILIVDDEPEALENCRRMLAGQQYDCLVESDARRALDTIERDHPHVLLTDLRMPGLDGIGLLQSAKRLDPNIKVILLTAYASVKTAVTSMKQGAFDYLPKPFSGRELRRIIGRAMGEESSEASEPQPRPSSGVRRKAAVDAALLGESPGMQAVRAVIELVAKTDAAVLLSGESGTGQECIARVIHDGSPRHAKSFVPVDCLASDDALVERELFSADLSDSGTGGPRAGLLESVHGGTLFFDDVANLSLRLQAKVLRVLKERRLRRSDGNGFYDVDARVIAASTQDLQRACRAGTFREDFYQYLSVVPISIPPLRQRPEDIELLSRALLEPFWLRKHRRLPPEFGFTADALNRLCRYRWPGNVRELQRVVERAAVLADRPVIDSSYLPDTIPSI